MFFMSDEDYFDIYKKYNKNKSKDDSFVDAFLCTVT